MSEAQDYYLLVENEAVGPFTRSQLVEGLMGGEVPADTLVATPQDQEWKPLNMVIQVANADPATMDFGDTMVIPRSPKDS